MPAPRQNQRPPLVVAMEWVTQVTTISLEMSLPAAGGYWLDNKWGTAPWLMIIGAVGGFYVAMKHLLALSKATTKRSTYSPDTNRLDENRRSDESTRERDTTDQHE